MNQPTSPRPHFHGVIPPLVTPLLDTDTLDEAGLERLVHHTLAGGVHGLFVLGTTGEGPSLSARLQCEVVGRTCELVDGRVPVLVGVTHSAFWESLHMAEFAAEAGADAVVLAPPFYFPLDQQELLGYFRRIVPELPLPVMLYNMPGMTKMWIETETVRQLTDLENLIGIKDSGGDFDRFCELLPLKSERPDWSIFIGPESQLADAVLAGADGGVAGSANVFPDRFVKWYDAAVAGDEAAVEQIASEIALLQNIYDVDERASRYVRATKCAASIAGLCEDRMAEPLEPLSPTQRGMIAVILEKLEPMNRTNTAEAQS